MSNDINYHKRAKLAIRSASDMGSDAHQTTSIEQVEQNLHEHIQTQLDIIWKEQGDKPDDEWKRIENNIIQQIPDALEEYQNETNLDFYDKRVLEQFDQL